MTKPQSAANVRKNPFHQLFNQPYVLLVLTSLFWGGNMVAGKLAVDDIEPTSLIAGRFALGFLIILPFAWPHLRNDLPKLIKNFWLLGAYGAVGFAGFNLFLYLGAKHTTAVNGAIEQASIPMMVMLANFVLFKQRAYPLQLLGVVLTLIGVIYVATAGNPMRLTRMDINIGDGLILIACLIYASYSVSLRYRPTVHWMTFLAVTFFFATLGALFYQIFLGGLPAFVAGIPDITLLGWVLVIYTGLFPSILSQLFYARGVELIGANRASLFINALPLFGAVLSVLIIGEALEPYHFVAAVFIISGITMAEYAVRTAKKREAEKAAMEEGQKQNNERG